MSVRNELLEMYFQYIAPLPSINRVSICSESTFHEDYSLSGVAGKGGSSTKVEDYLEEM